MKTLHYLILIALAAMVAGCEATGLEIEAAPQAFTPGVNARTSERTWEYGKPTEQRVESAPAYR